MEDTLRQLFTAQSAAGRALWVGLYPQQPLEISGWRVQDPHATILHVGRAVPGNPVWVDGQMDATLSTVLDVAARVEAFASRVGGVARFASSDAEGNPVVALVPDTRIRSLRELVVLTLSAVTRVPSRMFTRWDYTPHVTLDRTHGGVGIPAIESWPTIEWSHLGVTCGDAHARWPLSRERRAS